ncbi:MAG TPA: DUF6262 family protein [Acidimicrobiales bacterium]|nr:DUF6262 family protein [Acidimicrobiales bacterium]
MTATTRQARITVLRKARQRVSQDKRRQALTAVDALAAAGAPVTFVSVAKAAGVSTWLVRADGIREHIEAARQRQADHNGAPKPSPAPTSYPTTPAGLRADLANAREEIRRLRAEHDKLRRRLRLQLGAEIEGPDRAELIGRVGDLQAVNRQLVAERDASAAEAHTASRRLRDVEDELAAARESLRRVIKESNRQH